MEWNSPDSYREYVFCLFYENSVDPLPQALVLTSIVIDLAFVSFIAALAIRIFEKYGTFDTDKIRRLKG
jgi:multicomponent Na+:H+ antiporter subunit C